MPSLAQIDRQYATHTESAAAAIKRPGLAAAIKKAEKRLVRAALAARPKPAVVVTRQAGSGKLTSLPATPRFQARTSTQARIEQIDSTVRAAATRGKFEGILLDDLSAMFGLKPRSIEAMLRRNADLHTLRIVHKRVKLSTQQTMDLIDQQKHARGGSR
jgi:hypothetical protein